MFVGREPVARSRATPRAHGLDLSGTTGWQAEALRFGRDNPGPALWPAVRLVPYLVAAGNDCVVAPGFVCMTLERVDFATDRGTDGYQMTPILLTADESPAGHPCASTKHYRSDLALLNYLLQDLRALVRKAVYGDIALTAHETLTWEVHGLRRRTVICDPNRLSGRTDFSIVGFFGDRRPESDDEPIEEVEVGLLAEFRNYPGILSYSSVELVDKHWANLVVHTEPADREAWRNSKIHVHAAEVMAPEIYRSVRINNGSLYDGVIGSETIVIESTKYWDYDYKPTWHGLRTLLGGATEKVEAPFAEGSETP